MVGYLRCICCTAGQKRSLCLQASTDEDKSADVQIEHAVVCGQQPLKISSTRAWGRNSDVCCLAERETIRVTNLDFFASTIFTLLHTPRFCRTTPWRFDRHRGAHDEHKIGRVKASVPDDTGDNEKESRIEEGGLCI